MKEWKLLMLLEYEWRVFCLYNKIINWLINKKASLTSPILCFLAKRLDKHGIRISKSKRNYESQTGIKLVFYKCNK